eukprot:CAMPEP_0119120432 /NCGR_PEP_ID=MMETSP1310-20130426/1470_1 /TAXON_ID=464262 /ORGANISM="Genus nov. species nov., Strain RCC2339" /LENGTH=911 /DNA_ID=CAMNT_0007109909 /DNA_START=1 /DNA_END=2736 /DNA_ORIENTATION=-
MRVVAWMVVVVVVVVGLAEGVDRKKFKKCKDLGFCRRNRELAEETSKGSPFRVEGTFRPRSDEWGVLKGRLLNDATGDRHTVEVTGYKGGVARLTVQAEDEAHERYATHREVVLPDFASSENRAGTSSAYLEGAHRISLEGADAELVITDALQVSVLVGGKPAAVLNERGLLTYERMAPREEVEAALERARIAGRYKLVDSADGGWEENFDGHKDSKPRGPASVGLDVSFPEARHVYGLPLHTTSFALPPTVSDGHNGEVLREPYRFYNLDVFEYELDETMAVYGAIPLLLAHTPEHTVGILWMNAAETWVDIAADASGSHSHWYSETGLLDVFILTGPTPQDVYRQMAAVTGRADLPPYFALGYHQCRWNYRDEEDVAKVHQGFDDHDIPVDVLWLDIEHTDGKRYFTWDKGHFPTPLEMQEQLQARGRRLVTIVDPHLKRDRDYYVHAEAEAAGYYVRDKDGEKSFEGWCWPGSSSWLDYTDPAVADYWGSLFGYDKYQGSTDILFVWNDMNEPSVFNGPEVTMSKDLLHHGGVEHRDVHNLYGYLNHKATADGLVRRDAAQNRRPFVLSRSFFAGSQRWGAIWTGDNEGSWDHLRAAQPMLLSLSVAGLPFVGADVGGFFGNPEPELLLRWYQAGAYQPFFRGHAHHDAKRREPWLFGDPWTSHIRKAIRARYAHLPYWYTLFHHGLRTGEPPMRPLWSEFPTEAAIFAEEDSYMVGPALLVHPITRAGQSTAEVYLPGDSSWYDLETNARFTPGMHTVDAPLEKIPVFHRGGTAYVRQERARRSTTQMTTDPYTLVIALDAAGTATGELFLDDRTTLAYRDGSVNHYEYHYKDGILTSSVSEANGPPVHNTFEAIRILGLDPAERYIVTLNQGYHTRSLTAAFINGALVIRKPDVAVHGDWTVSVDA